MYILFSLSSSAFTLYNSITLRAEMIKSIVEKLNVRELFGNNFDKLINIIIHRFSK